MIKTILLSLITIGMTGCTSGVQYLGTVGDTKFYSVSSAKFDGPNINALVSEKDGKAKIENSFSGAGLGTCIGSTLVTSGSQLGSAVLSAEAPVLNSTIKIAKP